MPAPRKSLNRAAAAARQQRATDAVAERRARNAAAQQAEVDRLDAANRHVTESLEARRVIGQKRMEIIRTAAAALAELGAEEMRRLQADRCFAEYAAYTEVVDQTEAAAERLVEEVRADLQERMIAARNARRS